MFKNTWKNSFLAMGILALALSSSTGWGQTFYGSISGAVLDATGAVVPGAAVTLTNLGTSEKRSMESDAAGSYTFVNLVPGRYRLDAEKSGFKRVTREPIVVEVQSGLRIDIKMEVGAMTQTVEVTAQTPLLQPQTSSLGQVVESRKVQEMPLNGRNPLALAALVPGVVPQGGRENSSTRNPTGTNIFAWGNIQIGGGMANQSAAYIDGGPINTAYVNLLALVPTQDAIQEFKVETNNLGPEWGRFAGGVINLATKSGGNAFHGSVYEYLRNKVLNANDFFNNASGQPRPAFTQNQFGGNAGGRIIRDKLFWFAGYERFSERRGLPFLTTVPTAAMKTGDFSNLRDGSGAVIPIFDPCAGDANVNAQGTCVSVPAARTQFPGNIIPPNRLNPTASIMRDLWPTPNAPGQSFTGINNFATNASVGGQNYQINTRMDYNVSDKHRIFGRYTYWKNLSLAVTPFKNDICVDRCEESFNTHQFVFGDTYSFSPTTILDVKLSFLRFHYDRNPKSLGVDLTTFGLPAFLNNQVGWRHLPPPNVSGYAGEIMGAGDGAGSGIFARNDVYSIAPNLTKIAGRHTFKFGGEIRRNTFNYAQSNNPSGAFAFNKNFTAVDHNAPLNTGDAFASFLLGTASGGGALTPSFVAGQQIHRSVYVGDTFQISSKLTLNLGFRYDQYGPWSERFDRMTILMVDAESPLAAPTGLPLKGRLGLVDSADHASRNRPNLDKKMFSPRFGLAYRLNNRTVIRAGYGIFWLPNDLNWNITPHNDAVGGVTTQMVTSIDGGRTPFDLLNNPFPNGIIQPPGRDPSFQTRLLGTGIQGPLTENPNGYMQQWNFNIQREIAEGFLVDVAYSASKGTHLVRHGLQLNQLPEQFMSMGAALQAPVANPFLGLITAGPLSAATVQAGQLLLPFPQYTGVSVSGPNIGNSNYHSMQMKVEKRFKRGGSILVGYTVSKLISDTDTLTGWLESGRGGTTWGAENSNNIAAERAIASFDVPQRLVVSYVLDLPFGKGQKYAGNASGVGGKLVSGWGFNGITTLQSGFVLQPGSGQNLCGCFGGGGRPNVTGQTAQLTGSAQSRLNRWFDTSVFTQPAAFTFGNAGRTTSDVRSHGINNVDFAIFKNTTFGPDDRFGIQFRTEFFNIFNRAQFDYPGQVQGTAQFGVVGAQANLPRLVQFALRFTY